jgi:hypothetical protein
VSGLEIANFSAAHVESPSFIGKSLKDLDLRKRYKETNLTKIRELK